MRQAQRIGQVHLRIGVQRQHLPRVPRQQPRQQGGQAGLADPALAGDHDAELVGLRAPLQRRRVVVVRLTVRRVNERALRSGRTWLCPVPEAQAAVARGALGSR
jgi:hypothetical protein